MRVTHHVPEQSGRIREVRKEGPKEQFLEETEGYFLGSGLTEALYDSWVIRDFAGIDMGEEKNLTRVRY